MVSFFVLKSLSISIPVNLKKRHLQGGFCWAVGCSEGCSQCFRS